MATAEYAKKRREKLKEQHRCLCCGKQDERTLVGYVACTKCVERQRQYRKKRKSLHLCLKCGTQDERTLAGKICCAFCSKRQKLLYREKCKEFYEKKKAITERLRKDNEDFEK